MIVLKIILTAIMLVLPFCAGCLFRNRSISFTYLSGQFLLWAAFQVLAVPAVYFRAEFTLLFWMFSGFAVLLAALGVRSGRRICLGTPAEVHPIRKTTQVIEAVSVGRVFIQPVIIELHHI